MIFRLHWNSITTEFLTSFWQNFYSQKYFIDYTESNEYNVLKLHWKQWSLVFNGHTESYKNWILQQLWMVLTRRKINQDVLLMATLILVLIEYTDSTALIWIFIFNFVFCTWFGVLKEYTDLDVPGLSVA